MHFTINALETLLAFDNYWEVKRERINVVVTCTARKTKPALSGACLRSVTGTTLTSRFKKWRHHFERLNRDQTAAIDLYCGNAWSVIRKLHEDTETGARIRLWIISAGQGLLTPETFVEPYAATFSRGKPDSVLPLHTGKNDAEEWWSDLVAWRREKGQACASIADIARTFPTDPLIVAASNEYLNALVTDLQAARRCLRQSGRMIIISSGARKSGPLAQNFLPCDSRFEHRFGRGRMALNVKILASIVTGFPVREISIQNLRDHYGKLLDSLPLAPYPKRVRTSDEAVRKFIRDQLRAHSKGTHTNLLRQLRQGGLACEQARFRELFRELAKTQV